MPLQSMDGADVDQRVVEHLPLVRAVVAGLAHHYPRHCDREELVGAGTLGLVEAARRFDPSRGVPFERWAAVRIRGAVVDAVRSHDFAPRSVRAAARDLETVRQTLLGELGRVPAQDELAGRMGITVAELCALEGRLHRSTVLSLDAPVRDTVDTDATLASIVLHSSGEDPLQVLERRERDSYVDDALALLPERLRTVLVGYFLESRTSAELAEELGVTESRISQLRTEAIDLVRQGIAAQYGEPAVPSIRGRAVQRQVVFNDALAARSDFPTRLEAVRRPSPSLQPQLIAS